MQLLGRKVSRRNSEGDGFFFFFTRHPYTAEKIAGGGGGWVGAGDGYCLSLEVNGAVMKGVRAISGAIVWRWGQVEKES